MISCLYLFQKPYVFWSFLLYKTPDIKNLFILVNMSFWVTSLSIHNCCSPSLEYSLSIHVLGLLSSQAIFSRSLHSDKSVCYFFFTFSYSHFHSCIIIILYKSTSLVDGKIFEDKYFVLIIFL